jgi:xanthine dehydrogenase small subunit
VTSFVLNGEPVTVADDGASLLEALRDRLAVRSAKDGCSPQGQCGCCTVWVDGAPRVACVTPVTRVAGREVTTVEGLDEAGSWAEAFCATGASQCGFCTPGIIMRLAALRDDDQRDPATVRKSLLAHLCRCTGWNSIVEASVARGGRRSGGLHGDGPDVGPRDLTAAARRAELEGSSPQAVSAGVALGRGGFADDTAPADALVAVLGTEGEWVVGDTLTEARANARKVQGRRTTAPLSWPIEVPPGDWSRTLQTTWVEPAYLEPDASWCVPGGEPASTLANGGAFGGKTSSTVGEAAQRLANAHGRAVRVLMSREDTVRHGPKRPPIAAGLRADGSGIMRVARLARADELRRLSERIEAVAPGLAVEFVEAAGPPVSGSLRAAGWAEAAALQASLGRPPDRIVSPDGAEATARIEEVGAETVVHVTVRCGAVLDEVVLRSYCTGAAHMALGWVRSEGLAVGLDGVPLDLTIRSFGILRAVDTPRIEVVVERDDGPPVNGGDAVFAAVAAAAWRAGGYASRWPLT